MIRRAVWVCAVFSVVLTANLAISEDPPTWNYTWTDTLKKDLLTNYDRFARPSQYYNNATSVQTRINVVTVEVDDTRNVMAANVWLAMFWHDNKLKWNSSDYGGLSAIHVGNHEIWVPSLYLINSAVHGVEYRGDRHCIVYDNGEILLVEPMILHSYCQLNFTLWPFETNTCRLTLRSRTYDGTQVNLTLRQSGADPGHFIPISDWVLTNLSANRREELYDYYKEPYIVVDFIFELSRSSNFYYHIVFIPTVPIVILSLITFWLHPQSQIKLIVNASSIFMVVFYLIYFGFKVPPRYDSMPAIVKFYSACLYQASTSLVISILLINVEKIAYFATVPRPLRQLLMGRTGKYLGLQHIIQRIKSQSSAVEQDMSNDHGTSMSATLVNLHCSQQKPQSPQATSKNIGHLEWILLATAINRLVFLLFCFTFIIMACSYAGAKGLPSDIIHNENVIQT